MCVPRGLSFLTQRDTSHLLSTPPNAPPTGRYTSHRNVRELLLQHSLEPGFHIFNTFPNASAASPPPSVDVSEWMRRSTFCWVPPGQRYGDARRHVLAAFLGASRASNSWLGTHGLAAMLSHLPCWLHCQLFNC